MLIHPVWHAIVCEIFPTYSVYLSNLYPRWRELGGSIIGRTRRSSIGGHGVLCWAIDVAGSIPGGWDTHSDEIEKSKNARVLGFRRTPKVHTWSKLFQSPTLRRCLITTSFFRLVKAKKFCGRKLNGGWRERKTATKTAACKTASRRIRSDKPSAALSSTEVLQVR